MKRLVIFAHWDKNNLISDYVIYYLEELKKIAEKIIFVSDCNIDSEELLKIEKIVDISLVKRHEEYDFGSYKRGFLHALEHNLLEDYDQLIFANDSCYAPFFPFENMFETMNKRNDDFWGVTKNISGIVHLQSYFLVFNKNVFLSDGFIEFIKTIKKEPTKKDVINNYEIALSGYLANLGFSYSAYARDYDDQTVHITKWKQLLITDKSPFVKTSILRFQNPSLEIPLGWKRIITTHSSYPVLLIEEDVKNHKFIYKIEILFLLRHVCRRIMSIKFIKK